MTKTISNAHPSTRDALEVENVSPKTLDDLMAFRARLDILGQSASHMTHYNRLDEWTTPMHLIIREALVSSGFVNGQPDINKNIPDVKFWWSIYGVASNIIYSQHLKSQVAHHHSSAFERNEALKAEIDTILNYR